MRTKIKNLIQDYEELQEDRRIELRMYKVRWIWYHTILAFELLSVIILLLGIFLKL
jgi:type IV secretory pathway component VirB8